MKNSLRRLLPLLLALLLTLSAALPAAAASPFEEDAYATVLTGSDFQELGTGAYDRFGRILTLMKADGMPTPDSMLVGGDYTKVLFDYAAPGVTQIRGRFTDVYPEADPDSVICIQGNHDNMFSGFTKTGFYDMGVYSLYVINEDDYPWLQYLRPGIGAHVQKIAQDLEKHLNALIEAGDTRPVFVLTHLPLHHTYRASYGDNRYASYLFNALNAAGTKLDIVFLFGHQHSDDFDDYIGGSVNFLRAGETLRVPMADRQGADAYTEETLTFTYLNCGYVGYSDNTESETSTNALTLGAISISDTRLRFVKYSEAGLFGVWDVSRTNPAGADKLTAREGYPALASSDLWSMEQRLFDWIFTILRPVLALTGNC